MKSLVWLLIGASVIASAVADTPPPAPSSSALHPTPVDLSTGRMEGRAIPGATAASFYYGVHLEPGELLTELRFEGRANTDKSIDLDLLNDSLAARDHLTVLATRAGMQEGTKSFPIDAAGEYVIRLTFNGSDFTHYCVLLAGTAIPNARSPGCSTPSLVNIQPAKAVESSSTGCEEHLRVGGDVLFEFGRDELRPEAKSAIDEVATQVREADSVMIEGHTDGVGSDSYNQALSERRAAAVETALVARGVPQTRLHSMGYGKTHPIAPNKRPDGSDDPDGRRKNRRVDVVFKQCTRSPPSTH